MGIVHINPLYLSLVVFPMENRRLIWLSHDTFWLLWTGYHEIASFAERFNPSQVFIGCNTLRCYLGVDHVQTWMNMEMKFRILQYHLPKMDFTSSCTGDNMVETIFTTTMPVSAFRW